MIGIHVPSLRLSNFICLTADPLFAGDEFLRIIDVKMFLDGGMLTGSAYMHKPWGISGIYGITDPEYRGLRCIDADDLSPLVELAVKNDLQFTAHCVCPHRPVVRGTSPPGRSSFA